MEKYRGMGLKLTPQRLAILEYMEGNTNHPSAEAIHKAVSKKYPTMSFATVYNTLEALKRRGYLRELTIDPSKKRFDPNTGPHHHLICLHCRRIVDIHRPIKIQMPSAEAGDFKILSHHVEFYGLCSKCEKKEAGSQLALPTAKDF